MDVDIQLAELTKGRVVMVDAYIAGHSTYILGDWVRLPKQLSVIFYADFDANTLFSTGLAALNAGNVAWRKEYLEDTWIPNYFFKPLKRDEMVETLVSVSSLLPGKFYLIGVDSPVDQDGVLYMCTLPNACSLREFEDGHDPQCEGILNKFPAGTRLHLLSCRSQMGKEARTTTEMHTFNVDKSSGKRVRINPYGDDPEDYTQGLEQELKRLLELAGRDPQAAMQYVNSLPQATVASLRSIPLFFAWLKSMHDPVTRESSSDDIDALAKLLDDYATDVELITNFWRALPDATRVVMLDWANEPVVDFLEQVEATIKFSISAASPPTDFTSAWADVTWRNAFWRWLVDNPPEGINVDQLLELHSRLDELSSGGALSLEEYLFALDDLDDWFIRRWSTAPEKVAHSAEVLHERLTEIKTPKFDSPAELPQYEELSESTHAELTVMLDQLRTDTIGVLNAAYADYLDSVPGH